jgi:hypothetical protein
LLKRKFLQLQEHKHIFPLMMKILSIKRGTRKKKVSRLRVGTTMKMLLFQDLSLAEA